MDNEQLKAKYDEMHKIGASAWYGDGREERETILKMGEPWKKTLSLEIGCGEGDLSAMIVQSGGNITAIDYSNVAIEKAKQKWSFMAPSFRVQTIESVLETTWSTDLNRIVMQGVLEHLDNPFSTLQKLIECIRPKTVITSSPCFLNPRGIVWMTLDMLGAVMSKTDLHFLHPWDFEQFCKDKGYRLEYRDCDMSWGNHKAMIDDLQKRIPLALKDGNLPNKSPEKLLNFLNNYFCGGLGATMVYRIDI